jgi:hypothetical protein
MPVGILGNSSGCFAISFGRIKDLLFGVSAAPP